MFEPDSRYYTLENKTMTLLDGREVPYKKRRFIPAPDPEALISARHDVGPDERLDNITFRYLGDPTLFWMVCDMNLVMHPAELEEPGTVIQIMTPSFVNPR